MPSWGKNCYGETVEVTLVSPLTGEPKIPLSIPIGGDLLDVFGYAPPSQQTPYYPTKGCVKEPILAQLRPHLATGKWQRRYAELLTLEYDAGYRLIVAD
jgi:hypothetical protein